MPPKCTCHSCGQKYSCWGLEVEMEEKGYIGCTKSGCKGRMEIPINKKVMAGDFGEDDWGKLYNSF